VRRQLLLDARSVDSLPISRQLDDAHADEGASMTQGIDLTAAAGQEAPRYVRFNDKGTYQLSIATPGRADAALTVTVDVR